MDKGIGMLHIGIFLREKRRIISPVGKWMELESIMLRQTDLVRQTFLSYTEYRLDDIKVWGALLGRHKIIQRGINDDVYDMHIKMTE